MNLNIWQNLGILVLALACFALYGKTEHRRSWAARVINYTALALFAALVVLDAVLATVFDGRYLSALAAVMIAVACFTQAWSKKKMTKKAYKREQLFNEAQRRAEQKLAEEWMMEQQEGAEEQNDVTVA